MAKKRVDESRPSKMTFMVFQLEGDDATLQEGFRTISAALARIVPATTVNNLLSPSVTASLPAPSIDLDDDQDETSVVDSPSIRNTSRPKASIKSPQILDIELSKGDLTLSEFLNKHPTEETTKRYLLIAYWWKTQRALNEVSMDHVHTCFRHMGWQTPKQAAQPLRDMKSRLGWFHKGDEKGHYKINHVGENEVLKIIEGKS